jgi:hypothetical protein
MENDCLAGSFCVEIYASGIVLVKVLISCAPVVGVLSFFSYSSSVLQR